MGYLKQTFVIVAITAFVTICGVAGYRLFSPQQPKEAMIYPKLRALEAFELKVVAEKAFTLENLKGRWSFLFFGYTYCPDICPTTMAALKQMYLLLPPDIQSDTQVVLISVDPERDTPEHLAQYAQAFHPDFIGATGNHNQLSVFTKSFGVVYYKVGDDKEDYLVDHSSKIFLVDPDGLRHAIFQKSDNATQGFEYNVQQMAEDYRIIRQLAEKNKGN